MAESGEYGFYFDDEDNLCVGKVRLTDFVQKFLSSNESCKNVSVDANNQLIPNKSKLTTPVVIYSKRRLLFNVNKYKKAFGEQLTERKGINTHISYSLKANFNPSVLKTFLESGTWATLVNENELKLALKMGFRGENLVFNGNGKRLSEIELAVRSNCFINIDSMFNLNDTLNVAHKLSSDTTSQNDFLPAKVLLRVNVSLSAEVHSYMDTSGQSKFGCEADQLDAIIRKIKANQNLLDLAGFHIHLGSTIKKIEIFRNAVENLVKLMNNLIETHGLETIRVVNFGGGLGINYERFAHRTSENNETTETGSIKYPTPKDLAELIGENISKIKAKISNVVIEPGRSLVGDSAILLAKLIGIKHQLNKNFMVIDASMCECIRPCLYSAYHHIDFVSQPNKSTQRLAFDVVGPVCESGDFLGKNRFFSIPNDVSTSFIAVMDVGAYCSSMASNYNLHPRPAEVFIDHDEDDEQTTKYILTRRPESLDDILGSYIDY